MPLTTTRMLDRLDRLDALFRGARQRSLRSLMLVGVLGCVCYGAVMGSFGGVSGERAWQVIYSAVKVPLLLSVTFLLTLPSFFVINTLVGLRGDFAQVLQAVFRTQAVVAVVLASLAPYTMLWYASSGDYEAALVFNLGVFAAASLAGQAVLRQEYRPLITRRPRHRFMLLAWLGLYGFVGVQMGWVLRPFIGNPAAPTRFFRPDAWSNAYEVVLRLLWRVLIG